MSNQISIFGCSLTFKIWADLNVFEVHLMCMYGFDFQYFFFKVVFKIIKRWYNIITVSFPSLWVHYYIANNLFFNWCAWAWSYPYFRTCISPYFSNIHNLDVLKLNLTIPIDFIVYMLLKYSLSLLATPS